MRYRIMWMTPTGEVSSHLVPGCQHWIEEVPILEAFFYWMDH